MTLGGLLKVLEVYMGGSKKKTPIESLHSLWLFATAMSLDMFPLMTLGRLPKAPDQSDPRASSGH